MHKQDKHSAKSINPFELTPFKTLNLFYIFNYPVDVPL